MHRVALCHKYALVIDNDRVAAVAAAHEIADALRSTVGFRLVAAEAHLDNFAGGCQRVEDVDYVYSVGALGGADAVCYLLIVEGLVGTVLQKLQDEALHLVLAHTVTVCTHLVLIFHN